MRNRLVVLAVCLMLLAGVAAAAKFQPVSPKATDGRLGHPGLIVRPHLAAPPAPEPLPAKQAEGIRVLFVAADDGFGPIAAQLMAYPDIVAVDWYDARFDTPTVDYLLTYDVVVAHSNYVYADNVAMGDTLADYVDAGGKLIMSCFNWIGGTGWEIQGRILTAGYSPFLPEYYNHFSWACLGIFQADHPLMQGVSALCDYYRDRVTLAPGAELVASYADGEELVAVNGCIVAINMYVGPFRMYTGNVDVLVHNAILYLMESCGAPRDFIFVDDLGRSKLCINADGTFLFQVLTGPDAGEYEGTAQVVERAGVYVFMNPRGTPWTLYVVYDGLHGRAVGFYQQPGFDDRSHLSDRNTADNPDTCF
ncbi:MAG TPA: hypothetical protein PKM55_14680 [Acidobacteriota bacterium]|jgi:hypothetical protein|nr:hypothetical protein [Acidobacteriota bacterium]